MFGQMERLEELEVQEQNVDYARDSFYKNFDKLIANDNNIVDTRKQEDSLEDQILKEEISKGTEFLKFHRGEANESLADRRYTKG